MSARKMFREFFGPAQRIPRLEPYTVTEALLTAVVGDFLVALGYAGGMREVVRADLGRLSKEELEASLYGRTILEQRNAGVELSDGCLVAAQLERKVSQPSCARGLLIDYDEEAGKKTPYHGKLLCVSPTRQVAAEWSCDVQTSGVTFTSWRVKKETEWETIASPALA